MLSAKSRVVQPKPPRKNGRSTTSPAFLKKPNSRLFNATELAAEAMHAFREDARLETATRITKEEQSRVARKLETQLAADLSADDKHPATISVNGEFE
jgi:hypothetical protein